LRQDEWIIFLNKKYHSTAFLYIQKSPIKPYILYGDFYLAIGYTFYEAINNEAVLVQVK